MTWHVQWVTEVIPLLPGRPTRGNAHLDIADDVAVAVDLRC
jgi:hypothetical protein